MDSRKKPLIAAVLAVTVLASGAASSLAAGPAKPELSLTLDVRKEAAVKVTYRVAFSDVDLVAAIGRLATVYAFPYQSVQRAAAKRLIKKSIPDLTPEEAGEIVDEINDTPAGVE
jgi:hypothetical protein